MVRVCVPFEDANRSDYRHADWRPGSRNGKEKRWWQGGHFWWMVPTNGASRLPVCWLSALSSLSLLCSISVSSFSLFTVKWRNHRDVERLRRHDVNYRSAPRARRQTAGSAWQEAPTENYNAAWERKREEVSLMPICMTSSVDDATTKLAKIFKAYQTPFKKQSIKDYNTSFIPLIFIYI